MRALKIALFSAVGACALSACGPDNVSACRSYVETVNAQYTQCGLDSDLTADNTCPDTLNEGGVDCTEYYACLEESYECTDNGMQIDTSSCSGCI